MFYVNSTPSPNRHKPQMELVCYLCGKKQPMRHYDSHLELCYERTKKKVKDARLIPNPPVLSPPGSTQKTNHIEIYNGQCKEIHRRWVMDVSAYQEREVERKIEEKISEQLENEYGFITNSPHIPLASSPLREETYFTPPKAKKKRFIKKSPITKSNKKRSNQPSSASSSVLSSPRTPPSRYSMMEGVSLKPPPSLSPPYSPEDFQEEAIDYDEEEEQLPHHQMHFHEENGEIEDTIEDHIHLDREMKSIPRINPNAFTYSTNPQPFYQRTPVKYKIKNETKLYPSGMLASAPSGLYGHSMNYLEDGKLLVFGGYSKSITNRRESKFKHIEDEKSPSSPTSSTHAKGKKRVNSKFIMYTSREKKLIENCGKWVDIPAKVKGSHISPHPRAHHTAVYYDGALYVYGGEYSINQMSTKDLRIHFPEDAPKKKKKKKKTPSSPNNPKRKINWVTAKVEPPKPLSLEEIHRKQKKRVLSDLIKYDMRTKAWTLIEPDVSMDPDSTLLRESLKGTIKEPFHIVDDDLHSLSSTAELLTDMTPNRYSKNVVNSLNTTKTVGLSAEERAELEKSLVDDDLDFTSLGDDSADDIFVEQGRTIHHPIQKLGEAGRIRPHPEAKKGEEMESIATIDLLSDLGKQGDDIESVMLSDIESENGNHVTALELEQSKRHHDFEYNSENATRDSLGSYASPQPLSLDDSFLDPELEAKLQAVLTKNEKCLGIHDGGASVYSFESSPEKMENTIKNVRPLGLTKHTAILSFKYLYPTLLKTKVGNRYGKNRDPHNYLKLADHVSVNLHSVKMVIYGGCDATLRPVQDIWTFNLSTYQWEHFSGPPSREGHTAVFDPAAYSMLIFGGRNLSGIMLHDLWYHDLETHKNSQLVPKSLHSPTARMGHASLLQDHCLYISGGYQLGKNATPKYLNDLWLFDLTSCHWRELVYSLPYTPRLYHKWTWITKDQFVQFGGRLPRKRFGRALLVGEFDKEKVKR